MDHAAYHIIYVDSRLSRGLDGQYLQQAGPVHGESVDKSQHQTWEDRNPDCLKAILGEIEEVRTNLKRLLTQFNGVHTCVCEKTCMANLRRLDNATLQPKPTLVLSEVAFDAEGSRRGSEGCFPKTSSPDPPGLSLLEHLSGEISKTNLSKLIIPTAFVHTSAQEPPSRQPFANRYSQARPSSGGLPSKTSKHVQRASAEGVGSVNGQSILRCLESGAVDVLESPLHEARLHGLIIRATRCHKDALREQALAHEKKRTRKLSWLGASEDRPYAYLREKMVSDLMTGICNPDEHFHLGSSKNPPDLEPEREQQLRQALGSWSFWGHDYTEDELIHAAKFMLVHTLRLPGLERWQTSADKLISFLMASRSAYNGFVEYHNFRHVIDVMQATFYFLLQLGILEPFSPTRPFVGSQPAASPIASLLRPLDALTMLITAIGHDVGHPGVNNAFLVALNAPLAQLYNDRSVLEAFHCAAFSQILRRYWKAAFEDLEMRKLMINSILATDMGLHQKYMTDLGNLQDKLGHQQGLDGFNAQQLEEYRTLACALLIKCADISNVARPYNVAVRWANILQKEFADQGRMEEDVGIPTTLFGGPPQVGNVVKLGQSQKSFMNFFAQPLFESVADILPTMTFAVNELRTNQSIWAQRIQEGNDTQIPAQNHRETSTGALSPRSKSPERLGNQMELSHPEGLPAQSQSFSDKLLQPDNRSRRSSQNQPLRAASGGPDIVADASRRSSGAFSSGSNPNVMLAPRRTSNSSPGQLQLAPESRSHLSTYPQSTENRLPNNRASEDTLSQSHFSKATGTTSDSTGITTNFSKPSTHANAYRKDMVAPLGPTGHTSTMTNTSLSSRSSGDAAYEQRGHNRSSSGAHTNNTNASHSVPYSPTETQATSVLTIDSDTRSAHGQFDFWLPKNGVVQNEYHGSSPTAHDFHPGNKELESKASLSSNGAVRNSADAGQRSIGKKSSRFNIFHSLKKRANRSEAGH